MDDMLGMELYLILGPLVNLGSSLSILTNKMEFDKATYIIQLKRYVGGWFQCYYTKAHYIKNWPYRFLAQ